MIRDTHPVTAFDVVEHDEDVSDRELTRDYIFCMVKELRDLAQAVGLHDLSRALTQVGLSQFKD